MTFIIPNLDSMPAPVLNLILEDVDFKTIQILRKTCRYLRSHIDSSQFDPKLTSVEVRALPTGYLLMKLSTEDENYEIGYQKQEVPGYLITYLEKEKVIEIHDFASVAGNDLGLILRHHKSETGDLTLQFPRPEIKKVSPECLETFHGRFLASLELHLKSRKTLLQVGEFVLRGTNEQSQIMKVLPHLDPDILWRIEITTTKDSEEEPNQILKLNEIVEMEQWKNAKEVYIDMLNLDTNLGSFNHFKKAKFEILTVSTKELVELKENILKTDKFEDISFTYKKLTDKKNLEKSFGQKFSGSTEWKKIWYHNLPAKNRVLYISWKEKKQIFKFYSVHVSTIPDNALD